jgi:hypothetical protein
LNVGTEDEKGHGLKLFNHDEKEQEGDHRDASLFQSLTETHSFSADSRQKVIGQHHDFFFRSSEALLLFLKDHRGQARQTLAACALFLGS